MKFIPVGACPVCHFYIVLSKFGHKKTTVTCPVYNSLVSCLFSCFGENNHVLLLQIIGGRARTCGEKRKKIKEGKLTVQVSLDTFLTEISSYGR